MLKGAGSIVCDPAGACRINRPGAVWLHGAAADALVTHGVGPIGLTAGELADSARRLRNSRA
ncbi:Uncharacterised protein [Bordetella pertussis]|nr:Uncharacterised protein [Bordetella pertussis]